MGAISEKKSSPSLSLVSFGGVVGAGVEEDDLGMWIVGGVDLLFGIGGWAFVAGGGCSELGARRGFAFETFSGFEVGEEGGGEEWFSTSLEGVRVACSADDVFGCAFPVWLSSSSSQSSQVDAE